MGKRIALKVAGSGEIRDLEITPGTRVQEVLDAANLQGYHVSAGPDRPFLRADDDLYQTVAEGGTVWASTPATAGERCCGG